MRKTGPSLTNPLASVAERSAAARSRNHRFRRRALYECQVTQSASRILNRLGSGALFHINLKAEEGLAAGDLETYVLWKRRRNVAERLMRSRATGVMIPAGKS